MNLANDFVFHDKDRGFVFARICVKFAYIGLRCN